MADFSSHLQIPTFLHALPEGRPLLVWTTEEPVYDAPRLDLAGAFWEVEPLRFGRTGLNSPPEVRPITLHGNANQAVPAVHKNMIIFSQHTGCHINHLHSFMTYAPVRDAIVSCLGELQAMINGPDRIRAINDLVPDDLDRFVPLSAEYLSRTTREGRKQGDLHKTTSPGVHYVDRCYGTCIAKLIILYGEAEPFWFLGSNLQCLVPIFISIIYLFYLYRSAYTLMRNVCDGSLSLAYWKHFIEVYDPWIMAPDRYSLQLDNIVAQPSGLALLFPAGDSSYTGMAGASTPAAVDQPAQNDQGRVFFKDGERLVIEEVVGNVVYDEDDDLANGLWYELKCTNGKSVWMFELDLLDCAQILRDFHDKNPHRPGPPLWVLTE